MSRKMNKKQASEAYIKAKLRDSREYLGCEESRRMTLIQSDMYTVQEAFEDGWEESSKTMIEKAEKWLEHFLEKTIQKPSINDGYTSDVIDLAEFNRRRLIEEVLYDFKKAMEE